MYRFQRTALAGRGKLREAFKFGKEVTEYLNARYAPISVTVYNEVFGENNRFYWYADYPDLATIEKITAQLATDQEYWAILEKSRDIFIEGSLQDTLMQGF